MKALVYRSAGPAEQVLHVERFDIPEPASNELRIRVVYSGINPSDTKARAGVSVKSLPYPFVVPHSDGSGVVEGAGPGVDPAWLGKRVWFYNAQWQRQRGSGAEFVCLPVENVCELPEETSFEVGASIGIPLFTAWHAVHGYRDVKGKTVLVTGGAGNVGFHAIQLAYRAGARVIATASNPEKLALARLAGAELVVSYEDKERLIEDIQGYTGGEGVDLIIDVDAAFYAPLYPRLLGFGGLAVIYGSSMPEFEVSYRGMMRVFGTVSHFLVYELPVAQRDQIKREIARLLQSGVHQFPPTHSFAPEAAAAAHTLVERGVVGKAVIRFGGKPT